MEQAPLPDQKNAGPCPFTKVLYDASRYVELKGGQETPEAVGYTGEIQGLQATCKYKGAEPITEHLAVGFAFGKGPMAKLTHKEYRYWVAVTVRNIVIPRAKAGVSGANFEILVGFDVTPEMADFNRLGKRFRVNAGGDVEVTKTASAAGTPSAR